MSNYCHRFLLTHSMCVVLLVSATDHSHFKQPLWMLAQWQLITVSSDYVKCRKWIVRCNSEGIMKLKPYYVENNKNVFSTLL